MKKYILSIVLSNLFNIIMSGVVGAIGVAIIIVVYHLDAQAISKNPTILNDFLNEHGILHVVLNSLGAIVSILAGLIGAKIAKNKYILFGALSSIFCITSGVITISQVGVTLLGIILLILNPFLGLLGGYIYLKLNKKTGLDTIK